MKPLKVITPPGLQHYDCSGCGECCRGRFAILITEEDKARIETQGWTSEDLALKRGQALFTKRGGEYQLAHRDNGHCVFLQDDGLCRIHAKFGEPAKPLACRMYPFKLVTLGQNVRVDVRFDCPSSAGNHGRPVSAHRAALQELAKIAIPDEAAALPVPPLHGKVAMTWGQLARITEFFERVLLDVSLDITRRVAACVNLADILRQSREIPPEGRKLDAYLDEAVSLVQEDAVNDPLTRVQPQPAEMLAFRQIVGVYGRIDQVGEKANVLRRLTTSVRMVSGKGAVPALRDGFPHVAFADLEESGGVPSGEAAASLERYLHTHLSSMGFFGKSFYDRSYLDGLGSLLLVYPIACWFARAFARETGQPVLDAASVQHALQIVDHQHGITPMLDLPTERVRARFLGETNVLRSLVVWYGS